MMLPISVVIPTRDRPAALLRTLHSLLASTDVPGEFIIIDASEGCESADAIAPLFAAPGAPRLLVRQAASIGAAAQRNQGVALATCDMILFCDDDIIAQPDCIARLWQAMESNSRLGGVSASIVNQSYVRPGRVLRGILRLIGAIEGDGYAGRVVGPAIAFLPRAGSAAQAMPVEWLNLGCSLYRRPLLPQPPFDVFFSGYSIGEDVALSLRVGRRARLANVPSARIVHDSQPGVHKADAVSLSRMQFVNRHYLMTQVLGRVGWADHARLFIWEALQLGVTAWRQRGGRAFRQQARGRLSGLCAIARGRMHAMERAP